jgi:hypothetical protein
MKLLITFVLMVAMVVSGPASLHFFRASDYDLSSLLIITTYLSIVFGIYVATSHRRKAFGAS